VLGLFPAPFAVFF